MPNLAVPYSHGESRYAAAIALPSCFLGEALHDMISDREVEDLGRQFGQLGRNSANSARSGKEWVRLAENVVTSRPHATSVQVTAVCQRHQHTHCMLTTADSSSVARVKD